ncbi:hypothetical protein PR048_021076 [Dryococelus australis]|uniref:Uncharacterized protein n=1 Tax=Dryococelus australis TaxID=614101 RepID=A0ABQ9GX75_9NEOP|nr:hypothetical protein PR048_021076 [Dryococelus australis]
MADPKASGRAGGFVEILVTGLFRRERQNRGRPKGYLSGSCLRRGRIAHHLPRNCVISAVAGLLDGYPPRVIAAPRREFLVHGHCCRPHVPSSPLPASSPTFGSLNDTNPEASVTLSWRSTFTKTNRGRGGVSGQTTHLPPRRTGFDSRRGRAWESGPDNATFAPLMFPSRSEIISELVLRSTQKTVAPFELRAGLEIEMIILNHRIW